MTANPPNQRGRLWLGLALLAAVLIGVFTLPIESLLDQALTWQRANPALAALIYVLGVAIATPLMVPGSVLIMTAGFIFGLVQGVALASIGITLGSTLACLAGRSIARPAVAQAVAGNKTFLALNSALQSRGFLVVALTRLSLLIPFNVLNYAYGVSSVRLSSFIPATALGMLPAIGLFVYIGSVASDAQALLDADATGGATGKIVLVVGLIALVLATYVIHRTATAELKKHMSAHEPGSNAE
ncbi:MAG: TVP38/TMEM64 family protein [Gammaproteobacteria bacterium]